MLRAVRVLLIAIASSAVAACGGTAPQPPVVSPPAANETINGTERIGWDQPAADAVELASIRYAIYVDGRRGEVTGADCVPSAGAARFSCSARLPPLPPGTHTLQLASFVVDGAMLESARSGVLTVTVVPVNRSTAAAEPAIRAGEVREPDGFAGRIDALADTTDAPVDLALAPDGRVFVAERSGRIRIVGGQHADAEPAISLDRSLGRGQLLALALDPQFERTHFVYVLYASLTVDAKLSFAIGRLREARDTLGDAIILLDGVPASPSPAGALRFGPDAKLYAAFDAAGDARRAADPGSLNGKVLRLNPDGTTPADQPGGTPVIASGLMAPAGLAWEPSTGVLWVANRGADGRAQLRAIEGRTVTTTYALPPDVQPVGIGFARGITGAEPVSVLLIGSAGDARLLRIWFDPRTARPSKTERLIGDRVDAIRAIAIAPDGAIYFASSNSIGRLVAGTR